MATGKIGLKAPGHVYSATLKNAGDGDVTVEIEYGGSDASHKETVTASVPKDGSHKVEAKEVSAGDHQQRKVIQKITVKKQDGSTQELSAPFQGVTSPQQDWHFEIGQDGTIKSGSK